MQESDVCAVIYGSASSPETEEVLAAVLAQSRRPRLVLAHFETAQSAQIAEVASFSTAPGGSALAAGMRAARGEDCPWIWLLDGCAVPAQNALEALLAARDAAPAPPPLLLASKVIDTEGHLHPDASPRHEVFEKVHSIEAAQRHLVQLRATGPGSILIAGEVTERFEPPREDLPTGLDVYEWSARILRRWDDTGYLAPASVAVRRSPPHAASWHYWLARLRILASRAWSPTEKLWETVLLTRDGVAAISTAQGRSGVGIPRLSPSRRPRTTIGITRGENRLNRR